MDKQGYIKVGILDNWAYLVPVKRLLMKEESLYLDDVLMLSAIHNRSKFLGRPVKKQEIQEFHNIISYRLVRTIERLLERGMITNERKAIKGANSGYNLILCPKGEQLLIKYEKVMSRLIEGEK